MKSKLSIMKIDDYTEINELWNNIEGIGLRTIDDSIEGINKFLIRNSNTCFVNRINGSIVGTILAGNDGRRGYIYHLAVDVNHRLKGIGKQLVKQALESFSKNDIHKVGIVIYRDNYEGNLFWEKLGFQLREDLHYRNISLNESNK